MTESGLVMVILSHYMMLYTINNNARLVLIAISRTPFIKHKLLLDNIDISRTTLERILKQLSSEPLGLVEYQGALKTGGYVLSEKGKSFVESMND